MTRRPLVLQLIYTPKVISTTTKIFNKQTMDPTLRPLNLCTKLLFQDDRVHRCAERGTIDKEEWAEFLHTKDKVFTDWDEVRKEI